MTKSDIEQRLAELKTKVQENKVIVGTEMVIKNLRLGKLARVFLANNCPADKRQDIESLANLAKTPLERLNLNNEELGIFCKKNFFISVLGIKK